MTVYRHGNTKLVFGCNLLAFAQKSVKHLFKYYTTASCISIRQGRSRGARDTDVFPIILTTLYRRLYISQAGQVLYLRIQQYHQLLPAIHRLGVFVPIMRINDLFKFSTRKKLHQLAEYRIFPQGFPPFSSLNLGKFNKKIGSKPLFIST
jgi:hypothetical protein